MKKTPKQRKAIPAESIARKAGRGEDVSRFFTNGRMVQPNDPILKVAGICRGPRRSDGIDEQLYRR